MDQRDVSCRRSRGRISVWIPVLVRVWTMMLMWLSLMLWPASWAQDGNSSRTIASNSTSPTTREVVAVAGGRVLLPCNMKAPSERLTPVTQVVFLRRHDGDAFSTIYRLYTGGGPLSQASHWVPGGLVDRALVLTSGEEQGLQIEDLVPGDEGEYLCRLEFGQETASYHFVRLKVIVEPSKVVLFADGDPEKVTGGVAGPYRLGEVVTLTCEATGGVPRPEVTWWEGSRLLDDVSEFRRGEVTRNDLALGPLTRDDLKRALTCRASNAEVTEPLTSTVTLDLHYPPSKVTIVGEEGGEIVVRAELEQDLMCRVSGSRPGPRITWRISGRILPGKVSTEGIVTSSALTLTPSPEENGLEVTCSAYNPELTDNPITASTRLSVLYGPRLQLLRGLNVNFEDIEEGDDLSFQCQVKANPPPSAVQWTHDGEVVRGDATKGVYVSDSSLEIEAVTPKASGSYACSAYNDQGKASSNTIFLRVKFAPLCSETQNTTVEASAHVQMRIGCSVKAHPPPTSFRWTMNTSAGELDVPSTQFHWAGLSSSLLHTPPTQRYYRRVLCRAINQVGEQRSPCEFHVVPAATKEVAPAAEPESVTNCTVTESEVVEVKCEPPADEGLSLTFILEIQNTDNNVTEVHRGNQPIFTLKRLEAGVRYLLRVRTANSGGGRSPPNTFTFISNHTTGAGSSSGRAAANPPPPADFPSWFHTVVATAVLLLAGSVVGLQTAVVLLWRVCRKRPRAHASLNGDSRMMERLPPHSNPHITGSSTSINHIGEYIERERKRSLAMGLAPRASLDSLGMSTAPPSVFNDPLRSLQPSPCVAGRADDEDEEEEEEEEEEEGGVRGGKEEETSRLPLLETSFDESP